MLESGSASAEGCGITGEKAPVRSYLKHGLLL